MQSEKQVYRNWEEVGSKLQTCCQRTNSPKLIHRIVITLAILYFLKRQKNSLYKKNSVSYPYYRKISELLSETDVLYYESLICLKHTVCLPYTTRSQSK